MSAAAIRRLRHEPAFAAYLLALALLPIKWLSPLGGLSERAGWTDVFAAIAVALWLVEGRHRGFSWRPRGFYVGLGAYLVAGALSALLGPGGLRTGAENVVIMAELAGLALLTSDYASDRDARQAIVLVVIASVMMTAAIGAVGILLFYAGENSSTGAALAGRLGPVATILHPAQLLPSHRYERLSAGFYSAPLLGSYCIFASALVAREDAPVSPAVRRLTQAALAVLVVLTLSRAMIAFAAALVIRWSHRAGSRASRWVAGLVCAACIATMALLTIGSLQLDPTRPPSIGYTIPDQVGRNEAVTTSWRTFIHHPVLGTGPGSSPGLNNGLPIRAHLTPLNVAATVGLPALAALTIALSALWHRRRRPTDVAIWSGLAGLGIDGLVQDVDHFRHIWVMLGLAAAGTVANGPTDRPADGTRGRTAAAD